MNNNLTVIYVAYGNNEIYHTGVLFNWLRLKGLKFAEQINKVIVYTDHPEFFKDYPISIREITPKEISEWSLNGQYYFRIKTKALEEAASIHDGKILHIDSDILIKRPLVDIFNLISDSNCVFSTNQGSVGTDYVNIINSEKNKFQDHYTNLCDIRMYGSAIVGVSSNMLEAISLADKLLVEWLPQTEAHTIEQFALSQGMIRNRISIVTISNWFSDFNSVGKKAYAKLRLALFFKKTQSLSFEHKALAASKWRVKRTFLTWILQKISKNKH